MTHPRPHLSKSRYLAGRQCAKRLWLTVHARSLATPAGASQQALFDLGHRIGRRAHALFPGGVLITDPARRHREALARTRALLADPCVPAIFEAVFEHEYVRVHVDILERLGRGRFGLREVKATARVKDEHLDDLAIQRWVLQGSGLLLDSVQLVHIDTSYIRGEGELAPTRLFRRVELGDAVEREASAIPARVAGMTQMLKQRTPPAVEPGPHCERPHGCEFWEHCTRGRPADWIFHLPRVGAAFERLSNAGIERIGEIPDLFPLSDAQRRVRDAHRSGLPFVSEGLVRALAPTLPPALYLDFETIAPAEPLYPGTRPFEAIPFQWSLHRIDAGARLEHSEFLAEGLDDPRLAFAESLVTAVIADEAPILVWSRFEAAVLTALAIALPALAPQLLAIRSRLVDLHALVKEHVYLPAFTGSYSIKAVAPALTPGFGWSNEDFADGRGAAAAFERCVRLELTADRAMNVREALRAYCARDTEALVRVHAALLALSPVPVKAGARACRPARDREGDAATKPHARAGGG